jgi:hypothetical protein
LSALGQVTVGIADFPSPWLGMAFPGAIWIDQNAAGYGWYLDPTAATDAAFPATPGSPAYGKVDLLTVVEHELGHELGFGDTAGDGLMGVFLPTGTRRLPVLADPAVRGGSAGAVGTGTPAPAVALPAALGARPAQLVAEIARLLVADGIAWGTLPAAPQGAVAPPAARDIASTQTAASGPRP